MSRNVIIAASLPATPDKLFDMYPDAEAHAAFTGFPVTIAARAGAPFRAFNDMLSGTIIHVAPKRLIVQTWRSANWATTAIDSVLTLSFWPEKDGAQLDRRRFCITGGAHPLDDFGRESEFREWHKLL